MGALTNTQPIVLFPHTYITSASLAKIARRFGRLTICQPWFMDGPGGAEEEIDPSLINIERPPAYLKPKENFKAILSEYQLWMRQNLDKDSSSMLSASDGMSHGGESQWEIRKMISLAGGKGRLDTMEDHALKWHIILHLASEFEENSFGAEEILGRLRDKSSPLEGAVEDDADRRFLEDTPLMAPRLHIAEYPLNQLIEAWFGLFGEGLKDRASLITLDPDVVGFVRDLLVPDQFIVRPEEYAGGDFSGSDTGKTGFSVTNLPVADKADAVNSNVIRGLSGKTIILMEG